MMMTDVTVMMMTDDVMTDITVEEECGLEKKRVKATLRRALDPL
jgi:hypothetical protein